MFLTRIILFCVTVQMCKSVKSDLDLITKLPRIPLSKYHSYSSVMILHFDIPTATSEAVFKFKARDDSTSVLVRSCDPRNVSIYLKTGSYPVVNPDGVPLPKSFLNISRPELYELILKTDAEPYYLNISAPVPGNWFGIAFLSWTDPNKDRIQQQGLTSECEANLYTELYVKQTKHIIPLSPNIPVKTVLHESKSLLYKFFVPADLDHVLISIDVQTPCKVCDRVSVYVQSDALPTTQKYLDKLIIDAKYEGHNFLQFRPLENSWQFLQIFMSNSSILKTKQSFKDYVEFGLQIKYFSGLNSRNVTKNIFKNAVSKQILIKNQSLHYYLPYQQYNLMRLTAPDNFIFEYDFPPDNGSTPILLNVTASEMAVLKFAVYDIIDIGGTMTLGLAIKPEINRKSNNYTVVACIRNGIREIPTQTSCFDGNQTKTAPIILNSTSAGTLQFLHVPFPDPGTYFLTLRAFFNDCIPCNCSETCGEMIEVCVKDCEFNCTPRTCELCGDSCRNDVTSAAECAGCDCDGGCERLDVEDDEEMNASLVFSISSHPCIAGRCGRHGKCNHYMAGGFIFSSCQCFGGFKGWDCSDGSQALSDSDVLVAILLLTLSNLLFIPSVYFAYKRSYYTEACTYAASMVSSTFYHACDSKENQYGFCLFPIGVLQFLDFYCALMGIWVTLVAMAYTNNRVISICHVLGAIVLAFGVTYNKHALWVYLLPTLSGILIIGVNWGLQCRRTRKLFPAKKYLKLYMPLGAFLVLMGLISFAFLETKENYKVVHSLWHIVMAISLIFLLPNQAFAPKS